MPVDIGLPKLIALFEKRMHLRAELAKIEDEIASILSGSEVSLTKRKAGRPKKHPWATEAPEKATVGPAIPEPKSGIKRVGIKKGILAALKAAGSEGLSAKDLSSKLGIKNANVHIWFSTTGKKTPGVSKVGVGRWAYFEPK